MPTPKNKRKFALWLYPETLEKIGQLYTADDCRSKSEFIEKAVQFYIDHLTAEDQRSMLPNAMLSSMKSIVAESDNRISRLLFKMAVELAVTMNVVAASSDIDDITLERLKGECVKEVKGSTAILLSVTRTIGKRDNRDRTKYDDDPKFRLRSPENHKRFSPVGWR